MSNWEDLLENALLVTEDDYFCYTCSSSIQEIYLRENFPISRSIRMTSQSTAAKPHPNKRGWQSIVTKYQKPNLGRSLWQMANTLIPYVIVWYVMIQAVKVSYWLTLPLILLAAGLLMRNFIIFHDCGHGSFFSSRRANDIVGFVTGVLTFTPYFSWRHEHAIHHASSGDLDRRGHGDVWMMTVKEYLAASPWQRLVYRLYRNPLVLFVFGPVFLFLVLNRLPRRNVRPREQRNIFYTNLALLALIVAMSLLVGFQTYAILQVSVMAVAATLGAWLFYVQHQYEGVYWQPHETWDYASAALEGSSFYKLPRVLQWFTGNIGYHHIHHLSPRIPNYNLEQCHNENPMFQGVATITLRQSLGSLRYRLWDEANSRLIGYRELRQMGFKPAGLEPISIAE
jgi:omega-6 fatty acid desaturase (delta-12 desaturase)